MMILNIHESKFLLLIFKFKFKIIIIIYFYFLLIIQSKKLIHEDSLSFECLLYKYYYYSNLYKRIISIFGLYIYILNDKIIIFYVYMPIILILML
jgi:hypothetical protein